MFYRVKDVQPLPAYNLLVSFATGERKRYDVTPLFGKWDVFETLATVPGLFGQVKVDAGGYGISWNDDIDLSCNELWENGTPLDAAAADDLEATQAAHEIDQK
ncbi:MAG: DUF2442 domain-containing protein [Oscillospiraceae bacterium]|nr:DUF2442 domain-containing protein [Oscillospiraceae bacterium]